MNTEIIAQLRELFIQNNCIVSSIEYTKGNYDTNGKIIETPIPTITTEYSEIGFCQNKIYIVFILESETFTSPLLHDLEKETDVQIYGFTHFKKTLYPQCSGIHDDILPVIQTEKYVQIEFQFQKISIIDLYNTHNRIIHMFQKNDAKIVNQLTIDLKCLSIDEN